MSRMNINSEVIKGTINDAVCSLYNLCNVMEQLDDNSLNGEFENIGNFVSYIKTLESELNESLNRYDDLF